MKTNQLNHKQLCEILLYTYLLIISVCQITTSAAYAQQKSTKDIKQAALRDFAGDDLRTKNGPLVKAGFELALLAEEFKNHSLTQSGTAFTPGNSLLSVTNDHVLVEITTSVDPSNLEQELKGLGMQITGIAGPMISGYLPITSIKDVAAMQDIRFLRPSMCTTNAGSTTSQGDAAMHSDNIKTTLGYNGTGVNVGVLSDSYNFKGGAAADITSGDLPGTGNPNGFTTTVDLLPDDFSPGNTDEGRAMLQIIHDVAPGASLSFSTAEGGKPAFANHILDLRDNGANVIVDDMIYYDEPMFQDGVIAQAVDAAVGSGVSYFSSAGNNGKRSYESVWRSGSVFGFTEFDAEPGIIFYGGKTFDFDPGPGVDYLQSFTVAAGKSVRIVLQWDSPFASVCTGCPGSSNDIDFYIFNSDGTHVYAASYNQNIDGDAVETASYTNTSGSTVTLNLMIVKYTAPDAIEGPDPGFLKYVNFGADMGSVEYATNSSTIYGHANANGAEAVGAAAYFNTPEWGVNPALLNNYSSYGPTAIRFTTAGAPTSDPRLNKPEVTAPDGVNTTFFGSDYEGDGFPNFFGTSAAAPHAAAVAALMLDANGSLTPAQIYSNLETGASNMGPAGFDNGSGYGFIRADLAPPLPVELVSFEASANGNNTELRWQTATEVNNYGFEIEQASSPTSPRQGWQKIGFVKGYGNSNSIRSYKFIVNNPGVESKLLYRLKQIDNSGQFKYSNVAEITSLPSKFALEQNYPNPFNPKTTIKYDLSSDSRVKISVFNILGEKLADIVDITQPAGYQQTVFDGSYLSSGVYYYILDAKPVNNEMSFRSTKKMVLIK